MRARAPVVEHRVHRIRGIVLRDVMEGRYAEVLWDDDGSPTESGQRFLDSYREGKPGPVYTVTSWGYLRSVNVVDQLAELVP